MYVVLVKIEIHADFDPRIECMASHHVTVFGLGYNFLSKSNLRRCVLFLYSTLKMMWMIHVPLLIYLQNETKFNRIVNYPMV